MTDIVLETPDRPKDLYLARGDEVEELAERPLFTGDLLEIESGGVIALLQHPCSMRQGQKFRPNLLVAEVIPWTQPVPDDWTTHIKRMVLPDARPEGAVSVEFDSAQIMASEVVERAARAVIMSPRGVNLLLQRWVHHLTRVVVPSWRIHQAIAAQHEEADFIGEAVGDLVASGIDRVDANRLVDEWLDFKEDGNRRRAGFADPQAHSDLRRDIRQAVRELQAASSADDA